MRLSPQLVNVLSLAAALASLAIHVNAATAKGPDFDGDGFSDLAVGVLDDDVNGVLGAGSVSVIYGSNSGLASAGDQVWHLDKPDMPIPIQASASFGATLAWGDFDGDGRDDLAIGVPDYDLPTANSAGIVVVLYGSGSGLKVQGSQLWHQDSDGIEDDPEAADLFGGALAAGDFDHDGRDDLAIGVSGEFQNAEGAVAVVYGSPSGLTAVGNQLLSQDLLQDSPELFDGFGTTLAAGDFNNDNRDDLAVGVPAENIGDVFNAGVVHVIYGSNNGLKISGNTLFHQDITGIEDDAEPQDLFGSRLCTGDFNGDGRDDLSVASNETLIVVGEGAVHVLYGSSSGLNASGSQFWHQGKPGIADDPEESESFGEALIAGDFDGDGRDDLAIGVLEDVAGSQAAGAVHVLYGSGSGLKATGGQFWHQNKPGINNTCEDGDFYGSALGVGDFDDDGRDDLAIGVPGEGLAIPEDAVITDVKVHLYGLSHTYPNDIDILLESPTGQKVMLMSDVGSSDNIGDINITLDDAAPSMPPYVDPITTGTYKPTDHQPGDVLPGVSGPYSLTLASFNGSSPLGEWKLYIHDDFPGADNGSLNAWEIVISTIADTTNLQETTIGAVTTPYPSTMTINSTRDAGAVNVIYGTSSGLKSNGDQLWHRNQPSINDKCRVGDAFGAAM